MQCRQLCYSRTIIDSVFFRQFDTSCWLQESGWIKFNKKQQIKFRFFRCNFLICLHRRALFMQALCGMTLLCLDNGNMAALIQVRILNHKPNHRLPESAKRKSYRWFVCWSIKPSTHVDCPKGLRFNERIEFWRQVRLGEVGKERVLHVISATQCSSQILLLNAYTSPSELLSLPFSLTLQTV